MLLPFLFVALAAVAPAQVSDSAIVDLTECDIRLPVRPSYATPNWMRMVAGEKSEPYALPLELQVLSVRSGDACHGMEITVVEILLTNRGDSPFRLPVSRDASLVALPENRDRRTFTFSLSFGRPEGHPRGAVSVVQTYAAANIPQSYVSVGSGQSVRVRLAARVSHALQDFKARGGSFEFSSMGIEVYESTGKSQPGDAGRFGGPVASKNTVDLREIKEALPFLSPTIRNR